jgi:quercetin dioxygenase-like cupin family protein
MLNHILWDRIDRERLNPKLERQYVTVGGVTLARLIMARGLSIPTHHHPSEQITQVLSGRLKMWHGGREYKLGPGEILCIPSNEPHNTEVLEDTVCVDIFTPPRADWVTGHDAYLRGTEGALDEVAP